MKKQAIWLVLFAGLLAPVLQAQDDADWGDDWDLEASSPPPLTGFAELAIGGRVVSTDLHGPLTLGDARLRLERQEQWGPVHVDAKLDGRYDAVLETWQGRIRELHAQFTLGQQLDVKAGRQILTWGTGDYLFLNDLFPKDWQAFFAGRDDEYLKAPSDALKLSWYGEVVNINLVWTPKFDPDNYLNGEYFSFFSPVAGQIVAPHPPLAVKAPSADEWALRLYKTLGSTELAFYGYQGFYKRPLAADELGMPTFSRLRALGASVRLPLGPGLFNAETAYHQSLDDKDGNLANIPNSQWLFLLGYERELVTRLTGAFQLYVEHTQQHADLVANSPAPQSEAEQNRTLLTSRLTWRNSSDDLTLSLFAFYSPSDRDAYLRPSLSYRLDDHWHLSSGLNLFMGADQHTFFGQLEDNSNGYLRVRYHF